MMKSKKFMIFAAIFFILITTFFIIVSFYRNRGRYGVCVFGSFDDCLHDPAKTVIAGVLEEGGNDIKYKNTIINEFSISGHSLFIRSEALRDELYRFLGQQVVIHGKINWVGTRGLISTKSPPEDLRWLSVIDYSFMEVKEVEAFTIFKAVFPDKIVWGEPLSFTAQIINPWDETVEMDLRVFGKHGVFNYSEKFSLSGNQKTSLEISLSRPLTGRLLGLIKADGVSIYVGLRGLLPGVEPVGTMSPWSHYGGVSFKDVVVIDGDGYLK